MVMADWFNKTLRAGLVTTASFIPTMQAQAQTSALNGQQGSSIHQKLQNLPLEQAYAMSVQDWQKLVPLPMNESALVTAEHQEDSTPRDAVNIVAKHEVAATDVLRQTVEHNDFITLHDSSPTLFEHAISSFKQADVITISSSPMLSEYAELVEGRTMTTVMQEDFEELVRFGRSERSPIVAIAAGNNIETRQLGQPAAVMKHTLSVGQAGELPDGTVSVPNWTNNTEADFVSTNPLFEGMAVDYFDADANFLEHRDMLADYIEDTSALLADYVETEATPRAEQDQFRKGREMMDTYGRIATPMDLYTNDSQLEKAVERDPLYQQKLAELVEQDVNNPTYIMGMIHDLSRNKHHDYETGKTSEMDGSSFVAPAVGGSATNGLELVKDRALAGVPVGKRLSAGDIEDLAYATALANPVYFSVDSGGSLSALPQEQSPVGVVSAQAGLGALDRQAFEQNIQQAQAAIESGAGLPSHSPDVILQPVRAEGNRYTFVVPEALNDAKLSELTFSADAVFSEVPPDKTVTINTGYASQQVFPSTVGFIGSPDEGNIMVKTSHQFGTPLDRGQELTVELPDYIQRSSNPELLVESFSNGSVIDEAMQRSLAEARSQGLVNVEDIARRYNDQLDDFKSHEDLCEAEGPAAPACDYKAPSVKELTKASNKTVNPGRGWER